jgi:hypothetical protein
MKQITQIVLTGLKRQLIAHRLYNNKANKSLYYLFKLQKRDENESIM